MLAASPAQNGWFSVTEAGHLPAQGRKQTRTTWVPSFFYADTWQPMCFCDVSAFTTENKNPWITGSKVSQIQVQRLCREASPSADPADSWILL